MTALGNATHHQLIRRYIKTDLYLTVQAAKAIFARKELAVCTRVLSLSLTHDGSQKRVCLGVFMKRGFFYQTFCSH